MKKYIFITGGVVSGLGKGISASCIGVLLKSMGYSVVNQKADPYLNIDPGTMNPLEHGEVFVLDDGGETDLDLGHYERFTDVTLTKKSSTTAGKVYMAVLEAERDGKFAGKTIQVVPHITDEIVRRLLRSDEAVDIVITEIGGTVGDIESLPFIEAIREIKYKVGEENCCFVHLTLLPIVKNDAEPKTKPTQHSVKKLQELGIRADILLLRSNEKLSPATVRKLALFCNVREEHIIHNLTASNIYELPLMLEKEGLSRALCDILHLEKKNADLSAWEKIIEKIKNASFPIHIALVGKYISLRDAYLSVLEALNHAALEAGAKVSADFIDAEEVSSPERAKELLKSADGILVPGGFGERGIEGMVNAARYARENGVPYFGICLGMQIMAIEGARNVLSLEDASSTEFSPVTLHPVIHLISDQLGKRFGGTLRLGKFACRLSSSSLSYKAYGKDEIYERHRHRYEFNNDYRSSFEKSGYKIAGINEERDLVEILEKEEHPWMVGVQFHPEFKSRPGRAAPLFLSFVRATMQNKLNGEKV